MRITAVLPVRNKADVLEQCLASICVAMNAYPGADVVVVDNGSTDGSLDIQRRYSGDFTLLSSPAHRIGAVRNAGARGRSETDVYAFIDCDCVVSAQFFADVERTFAVSQAAAVGCEVRSPVDGHWTEIVWDGLHRPGGDGPRRYINSACFCIRQEWFWKIQGFDEQKVSSEDVDICRRLSAAGGTMWQSESLAVLHLGNPKSLAGLYRRIRWHGQGVWENGQGIQWSVTTTATLLHPVAVLFGVLYGGWLISLGYPIGALVALGGLIAIPFLFVAARGLQHRRRVPVVGGIALMFITFMARLDGLFAARRAAAREHAV